MRFVLEEGNTLTLRESDGTCVRVAEDIVPKHHRLLIKSEDLVYITYKHPNFQYKRYNPQTLELELLKTIQLDPEQDDEDSIIPLAAYCSDTGKAFFITVSKETRDIWVRETDNSGARKVDGKFPKDLLRRENLGNNKTSFLSAHIGQSEHKYAVFLSAKYRRGVWTIAIDVPKNGGKIKLFHLKKNWEWSQYTGGEPFYFGNGIEPQSISIGLGGHVLHATPQKEGAMEVENDSIWFYKMRYITFRTALALFGWTLFSAALAFFTTPLLSTSWIECIEGVHVGCSPLSYADKFFLIFSCVFLLIIATHLVCWRLFPKSLIRHNQMVGVGIYPPAFRSGKIYNYRLFKFTSLEKFCLTSPSTIAFLQEDKIQTYDFINNKIIEKPIRDFFGGYSFVGQICEAKENQTIGAYKNKGTFVEVKLCDVGTAEVNTISFSISHEMDDQPNQVNSISNPSDQDGSVSLRMVLIDYQEDAFEPFKPNKRVRIEHTMNPMRLIIQAPTNSNQIDFYKMLRHSPKIWSTLKQISNLTDFVDDHDSENEVVFELDEKKTLVHEDDYFDRISQRGEGTFAEDGRLRLKKGNKELAPSLETAIFLENSINRPVSVFLSDFSDNFPQLMKSLWVGDRNQEIHQLVETFNIEDDLPAMSYIQNKAGEYEGASPKQNTEMWHDWPDYLPRTELNAVFEIIKEKKLWSRNGHAHQMMHGDLRPANVVVNAGEIIEDEFVYDLFLCDFPDVVARSGDGEILYRTEIVDGTHRVTSHFFETEKAPKINPMLDLARFFAYMLIKIPFEPTAKDAVGLAKEKRIRRTQARNARQADFRETVREQLDRALTWSENNLRDVEYCVLVEEGKEDSWRELLKAMIFDQCLQIMMHWKRGRGEAAIENDLTLVNLCEIFYDVSPTSPDLIVEEDLSDRELMRMAATRIYAADQDQPWNDQVVKIEEVTDYNIDLDPTSTSVHANGVSIIHLPKIIEKVIENGFPIKSLRRKTSTRSDRDCFDFRFEVEDFQWLCSCYIEGETMVISYMREEEDWDWEWDPHWS
jgi:hypothetical protein